MPKEAPTQNPIAISRRTSGPRSPFRCGLSRLFTIGGIAHSKGKRGANLIHFLRPLAVVSMANKHITAR